MFVECRINFKKCCQSLKCSKVRLRVYGKKEKTGLLNQQTIQIVPKLDRPMDTKAKITFLFIFIHA